MILGVKFNASLRLDRWQIVFVGSRSSSSPIFEILFHLFLRFTFLLNLFKRKTLLKTVLDFVLFVFLFQRPTRFMKSLKSWIYVMLIFRIFLQNSGLTGIFFGGWGIPPLEHPPPPSPLIRNSKYFLGEHL